VGDDQQVGRPVSAPIWSDAQLDQLAVGYDTSAVLAHETVEVADGANRADVTRSCSTHHPHPVRNTAPDSEESLGGLLSSVRPRRATLRHARGAYGRMDPAWVTIGR